MTQNLVSVHLSDADLSSLDQAIAALEVLSARFVSLSGDEVRGLTKMGDKSEPFCRQTLMVLEQNRETLPPSFDLAEMKADLAAMDVLRPRVLQLKEVLARMEDTLIALGSDTMVAASEGYALMKMFGKAEGLSALQQTMLVRRPGRPRQPEPASKS